MATTNEEGLEVGWARRSGSVTTFLFPHAAAHLGPLCGRRGSREGVILAKSTPHQWNRVALRQREETPPSVMHVDVLQGE